MNEGGDDERDRLRPRGAKRKPRCDGLLEEVPSWQRDGEYIKTGYRVDYESGCEVASTLCRCHNESTNIWTHLIGAIVALALGIFILAYFRNTEAIGYSGLSMFNKQRESKPGLILSEYIMDRLDVFN